MQARMPPSPSPLAPPEAPPLRAVVHQTILTVGGILLLGGLLLAVAEGFARFENEQFERRQNPPQVVALRPVDVG
jgi:hypothetical protein